MMTFHDRGGPFALFNVAAQRLSYGRQGSLDPHRQFKTPRDGFPITGLLSTQAFVIGTPLRTITHSRSLARAQSELDLCPVFTTLFSVCPRPGLILSPCLLVYRPYVSISSPLQSGISFLGHPTPPRLTAWSPAPALPERALAGFPVPCVHFSWS
jgi:hypothetical protein